ncbi:MULTISPECIES: nucleoside triphosphate hydrolase [Rhizobiaceae]|uniref:Pantothenate kinase n=1 Tax=Aliirhizobium cellulosilyticum TaxID=393664 RepID=A0A7W6Y6D5_9HYPH|nr:MULTISPECIES: nucleoside triphosphate hydrolase [Rhizobium/Agrobacterium group]MBB4351357.1 pantothenate kinase [Rhizobium cellulosilyticum]MBB4414550.1 pantothenate kinase [Rhizobium cellulosilyticum]MBB4449165.1 pantothenate kinase [Rhizobium cellulosilyticum]MBO0144246.1 nucleoside triphosphate hydrolase [Agrobacterium sp. Ap1]
MTMTTEEIARTLINRAGDKRRFIVAIAGPPGAGKSTLADALVVALQALCESAEVLPMDGFHMDNGVLQEKGLLSRKGAPETFDVRGFLDIIRSVRVAEGEVLVPVFDRSRELAITASRVIEVSTRFVLVEGNYLLLDRAPWSALDGEFDYEILISPPVATLEERLMDRWRGYGLSEEAARAKTQGNDLKNGALVRDHCRGADIILAD